MNVLDFFHYLLIDAEAIRTVANTKGSLLVGAIFVASAALSRSWSRRDLSAQPWILAMPLVASTISAGVFTALFCIWWSGTFTEIPQNFGKCFPTILGLFWMTAPLAWLYGIPFERWLNPIASIKARLKTLLVVSIWRVTITIYALHEVFQVPLGRSILFVLVYGNLVAILAMFASSRRHATGQNVPRIMMMMGVITPQHTDERKVISNVSCGVTAIMVVFGVFSFPYFLNLAFSNTPPPFQAIASGSVSIGLWAFSLGSVIAWLLVTPIAQRKARRKTKVAKLIASSEYDSAAKFLDAHQPKDFPSGWALPLEAALIGERPQDLLRLASAVAEHAKRDWLVSATQQSLLEFIQDPLVYWYVDEHVSKLTKVIDSLRPTIDATVATETLQRLHELKGANDFHKYLKGELALPGKLVANDTRAESGAEPATEDVQNELDIYATWPEMTEERNHLQQLLTEVAGDSLNLEPNRWEMEIEFTSETERREKEAESRRENN